MHEHTAAATLRLGFIRVARALFHTPAPGDGIGRCGLCGHYVWISQVTSRFLGMQPTVAVLCCVCGELSRDVLRRALPGQKIIGRPVPDLARQGVFN